MMRWGKVRAVLAFEFLCAVRSKSWRIVTFGMPVFLLAYAGLVSIPLYFAAKKDAEVVVYGLVDEAGVLSLQDDVSVSPVEIPPEVRSALQATGQADVLRERVALFRNFVFRPFPAEEPARAALRDRKIRGYFRVPRDYVQTGEIEKYSSETAGPGGSETRLALGRLLVNRLIEGKLSEDVAARVREPIADTSDWIVTATGEVKSGEEAGRLVRILVPLGFAALLLVSIFMSAGALLQATGVEKENKVVEVLLSSANPDEILIGKLLGLGAAGTLQMAVWFGMVAVTGIFFTGILAAIGIAPPWAGMAAAFFFFPLAYLFFGSLMLGTGSLGSNQREAQQWGMAWSLLAVLPMVLMQVIVEDPHGVVSRVATWVPFAAPTTVVFRLSLDPAGIAWWEIAGSSVVLILSIWFTIRLGARLFRVGIVLTGARPKLREILRQARLGTFCFFF